MFTPPFCPYRPCAAHHDPPRGFFVHHGTYHPNCRPHPVQRYRCRVCRRTFSRQTFRMDYRDHKPHLNAELFRSFVCGVGLRQSARVLGISLRCAELKVRKIGRHLRRLNLNLQRQLPPGSSFQFDELETYEEGRNTRPLTLPILIEAATRFIVWAESATIRPRGKMTEKRRKRVEAAEKRYGPRRDRSRRAIERTLRRGADISSELEVVVLHTDEKSSYPGLAKEAFGADRLVHSTTNSKLARGTWNELFPVNHEEAVLRDLCGRTRRQSWLTSKKRRYLDIGIHLHIAYRNWIRRRFNRDRESAAQLLGFAPRRMTFHELLSWRQEFGKRSPHPLSRTGTSIASWMSQCAQAA